MTAAQTPSRQSSFSSMLQRQTPSRENSFVDKMRDSLTRFPSFTSKRHSKPSNHSADEMNVFASDIVSKEYVLEALKDVRHNPNIVKLEIEDLMIAKNHNAFLPVILGIFMKDERKWKQMRFVDTIGADDVLWWTGMKNILMRDYEAAIDDRSKYVGLVSFQANVQVAPGASKQSVRALLKGIQGEKALLRVGFSGALFGFSDEGLPNALKSLFDEGESLQESIVINIHCGWKTSEEEDHCKVLEGCLQVLNGDTGGLSQLEAKIERGQSRRRRRRTRSSNEADDVLSLTSHHSTTSGTSLQSTRSDGTRRRSQRHSRSADRPVIVQGSLPRRCITLPSRAGAVSPKRRPPSKSKSFNMKRPNEESDMGTSKTSSTEKEAPPSLPVSRRTKSFRQERPTIESLSAKKKDRWSSDNRTETESPKEHKQASSLPRKPPRSRSSSRSASSTKPKLRRIKSLNRDSIDLTEHGNTDEKNPDYDWGKRGHSVKHVLPSAA